MINYSVVAPKLTLVLRLSLGPLLGPRLSLSTAVMWADLISFLSSVNDIFIFVLVVFHVQSKAKRKIKKIHGLPGLTLAIFDTTRELNITQHEIKGL